MPEGVICRQEEPTIHPAPFHNGRGRALGEGISIVDPVDSVGRAGLAGQGSGPCGGGDSNLILLLRYPLNRERNGRVAEAENGIDHFCIVPTAGDSTADVRLVLKVRGYDFDGLTINGATKVLYSHSDCGHVTWPLDVSIRSGHIVEHTDLNNIVRDLGPGER